MPSNKCQCQIDVKRYFTPIHSKCHKTKHPHKKSGYFLNSYCTIISNICNHPNQKRSINLPVPFVPHQVYNVCDNLMRHLLKTYPEIEATDAAPPVARVLRRTRDERAAHRMTLMDFPVDDDPSDDDVTIGTVEVGCPDLDPVLAPPKPKRMKFTDKILLAAAKFKKPFKKLLWRKRLERINDISIDIIAACIDRTRAREEGVDYIVGNEEFAHEVLNIVDALKESLGKKLKVDMKAIAHPDPIALEEEDEDNVNTLYFQDKSSIEFAVKIMGEVTGRGFQRIRKSYNDNHPDKPDLPSLYKLNNNLPLDSVPVEVIVDAPDSKDLLLKEEILLGIGDHGTTQEDAFEMFGSTPQFSIEEMDLQEGKQVMIGAKLDGSFEDYLNLMKKKHISKCIPMSDSEDVVVISSFDGAKGLEGDKNVSNVISFSSSLFTPRMIQDRRIKAGESFNILTWLQVIGKETFDVTDSSLRHSNYWSTRKDLIEGKLKVDGMERSKVFCYECHDGKMLYSLTQHSQWNRKYHPFLLCKCKREDGLDDSEHDCDMWTDDSYKNAWDRSKKRWEYKSSRDPSYIKSKHRDWCDKDNFGVTHYGISPSLLQIETIRMDVFHCKCAIIRRMMECTRRLVLKHSSLLVKSFTENVLKNIFSEFHIFCWNNGLNFSKFKGHDLSMFVFNIDKVANFIKDNLQMTEEIESLTKGLLLLEKLFKFLSLTYLQDTSDYLKRIEEYERNVKDLFKFGKKSYLNKESGNVTFYFHVLRYYFPKFAKSTLNAHGIGIGIFSMQGFERRNKESKNTLKRFATSNRSCKSLMVNNIRRLEYVFLYNNNAY